MSKEGGDHRFLIIDNANNDASNTQHYHSLYGEPWPKPFLRGRWSSLPCQESGGRAFLFIDNASYNDSNIQLWW